MAGEALLSCGWRPAAQDQVGRNALLVGDLTPELPQDLEQAFVDSFP